MFHPQRASCKSITSTFAFAIASAMRPMSYLKLPFFISNSLQKAYIWHRLHARVRAIAGISREEYQAATRWMLAQLGTSVPFSGCELKKPIQTSISLRPRLKFRSCSTITFLFSPIPFATRLAKLSTPLCESLLSG